LELPLLRERQTQTIAFLERADVEFSAEFLRIMQHSFRYAEPVCASLLLWATDACGGDSQTAIPVAASVECLHRFSVLHDELQMLPTISIERESTSSIWGLAQTLNAGDAFHALGMGLLTRDAVHLDRVLDAGIELERTMLAAIDRRNRLVRNETRVRGTGRLRAAYDGTYVTMLGVSLRVGAIMAGAQPQTADMLARAGRLLGVVVQLAHQSRGTESPLAQRYAAKAAAVVEAASLTPQVAREFKEIAYELAAAKG
jgi:geranylgeranyl pyrophosphate synthase